MGQRQTHGRLPACGGRLIRVVAQAAQQAGPACLRSGCRGGPRHRRRLGSDGIPQRLLLGVIE